MKRTAIFTAIALILAVAGPARGYRLRSRSASIPSSAQADRWDRSDFPLRFRMLENDNVPVGVDLDPGAWAALARRSFTHWTGIPTAQIDLILEDETVERSAADQDDGVNTIGFSSDEAFVDSWFTAYAAWRWDGDELVGCDIEVNPDFVKNWAPQDPYQLLEVVLIHEMGHCLGLAHTEPYPMPLWTELPVRADPSFLPDPIMSYSNSYGVELSEDEIVAVSLLYPAPGFLGSVGSVSRAVGAGEQRFPFAYVQAVRPGEPGNPPRPGPGAFTDENGDFHLEGLTPGHWILWVHPILVTRRNAHGRMLEIADESGTSRFAHFWAWVRVGRGQSTQLTGLPTPRNHAMSFRFFAGSRGAPAAAVVWSLLGCSGGDAPPVAPTLPPPPAPLCSRTDLEMTFLGQGESPQISRGRLTLETRDLRTSLHFVSPYEILIPDGGANLDVPGLRPTLGVFVSDLAFDVLGSGYRQTMTLEWLSDLELYALEPDCEPLTVACDAFGCTGP